MNMQAKCFKNLIVGGLTYFLLTSADVCSAAAVIYEQSPLDPIDGYQADVNAGLLNGDNFTIGHTMLQSISWWGTGLDLAANVFEVKLYDDPPANADAVAPLIGSLTSPVALFDSSGADFYRYQLDLSVPFELSAGNHYLSIQSVGASTWYWLFGDPGDNSTLYFDGSTWFQEQTFTDMAFRLEGESIQDVPEPNTFALLLLGVGLVVGVRKRSE